MILLAVTALVFAIDTCIKAYVDRRYARYCPKEIFGGRVQLDKFYNKGAAFGFLSAKPGIIKIMHTAVMAIVAVYYYFVLKNPERQISGFGMALLAGGGLSNLFDRYKNGYVIDYLRFAKGPKKLRRIIFNVSDFFVFIGALITALGEGLA